MAVIDHVSHYNFYGLVDRVPGPVLLCHLSQTTAWTVRELHGGGGDDGEGNERDREWDQ